MVALLVGLVVGSVDVDVTADVADSVACAVVGAVAATVVAAASVCVLVGIVSVGFVIVFFDGSDVSVGAVVGVDVAGPVLRKEATNDAVEDVPTIKHAFLYVQYILLNNCMITVI